MTDATDTTKTTAITETADITDTTKTGETTETEIRPWPPVPMVLVTLFGGLPAGGTLLGLNWARFGNQDRARRDLLLFAVVTVGTSILSAFWVGGPDQPEVEQARVRWLMQSIHVGTALLVAFQQRGKFEEFLLRGGKPGNVLLAIPLALGFGILVQLALARVLGRILFG